MQIVSFIISIGSFLFGISIFGCYGVIGERAILEGAPGWILIIAGAPTTFLFWVIHRIGLDNNLWLQYIWVCFFYLLQYQLIAFFVYKKFGKFSWKMRFILLIVLVSIIIISVFAMKTIILGK